MRFCSIASGSSGNCYYFEADDQKYLVDAGISFKRIKEGLASIGVDISDISGLFVTHEHTDHVSALPMIMKKTTMPVFSSAGTLRELIRKFEQVDISRLHDLPLHRKVLFGKTTIQAFDVHHDAAEPVGYTFTSDMSGKKMGIVTDTGQTDDEMMDALKGSHLLVLEANYDDHMLKNGEYPAFLKRRILSSKGHLSNLAAARVLHDLSHPDLSHVFLGHLSKENNLPYIARDSVCQFMKDFSKDMHFAFDCLSRNMPGKLITLD